ncbi:unnamed protein product [Allacma fusca]|uniref:Carboxylic ester hydrolase n=2 Tax=Allacma fusca TaxID=39272 RepID=A0A8J2LLZ8_9HEXA|nr:unnamed protein product [Allacma fusca]
MEGQSMSPVVLFLGSVAYLYSSVQNARDSPDVFVNTTYGTLKGLKSVSRESRTFFEFRGIPYAEPPVGLLRFEPPERPTNWGGIRDATKYGSRCWQLNFITQRVDGKEDCLFLNVYTHRVLKKEELGDKLLYPVLVYIHGGFFVSGSSNVFRPKYFMDENVVLVTINYRLASFGFLTTGDDVIRGNMGFKDQNMALQWVQENIAFFGGDPRSVTLVGESAGAVSVHLHMLSPMSAGLFHRVISQSGTCCSLWARGKNPRNQARNLGRQLSCPTQSSQELAACLKTRSARRIARSHAGFVQDLFRGKFYTFGPVVETANDSLTFLADDPKELLTRGAISNKVPWINGVNADEGLIYLIGVIRNESRLASLNLNWTTHAPVLFGFEGNPAQEKIATEIRDYYLGPNSTISMKNLQDAANMFSDRAFFEDSHDVAVLQSRVSPVYSYYLSYKPKFGIANFLLSSSGTLPHGLDIVVGNTVQWISSNLLGRQKIHYGVCHTDELPLFYNLPAVTEIIPGSPDYFFSKSIVKLWVSFAKKGKPGSFGGVPWVAVHSTTVTNVTSNIQRIRLDQESELMDEPFLKRLNFWKSLQLND